MDAIRENLEQVEDVIEVVEVPIHHPEFYRTEKLVEDKGLNRGDVIARAKARGLRDYRDRVILAVQDDDLKPEMGGMFSRTDVDNWIDAELAVDQHEDQFTISLQQARALAKESGLEDYSAAVLNAITRLEIEGVEYRRGQPRIPIAAFEAWLEIQGSPSGPVDPEIEAIMNRDYTPTSGEVMAAGVEMYGVYLLVFLGSLAVIVFVFANAG